MIWTHLQVKIKEQIFSLPRNVCPRKGTGLKTDFFCKRERERVSLSEVVGKKDGCLKEQMSAQEEQGKTAYSQFK